MVLAGERLSYRTLDVEQIGSVYEAIMGFRVELTTGHSIAVRSQKRTGAGVVIDLDALLAVDGSGRGRELQTLTDRRLTGAQLPPPCGTPTDSTGHWRCVGQSGGPGRHTQHPAGGHAGAAAHRRTAALRQPLHTPIPHRTHRHRSAEAGVRTVGAVTPTPEEMLDLKILDLATGSGAFLVEACRQVAEKLVEAWHAHGSPVDVPVEEDQFSVRQTAGDPTLPLRGGQEPHGHRPGPSLPVAHHPVGRPRVHLRGPRPAPR